MRQAKKPTRRQKMLIKKWRLNPKNWLVLESTKDYTKIVHRYTDTVKTIKEGA
ncbi:DUF6906 family protein [Anaerovorax odorimutans]|uniref:DUF6906 family protein n=1 Tax=Anaerovorax odorimutans TaxID=109327 RepID=UPI003B5063FE